MSEQSNHPYRPEHSAKLPIELNRRLISTWLGSVTRLTEYYDEALASRIIAMPPQGPELEMHQRLERLGAPVFSSRFDNEENFMLVIPSGTRTLRQSLKFIARDIDNYGNIFRLFGKGMRVTSDNGLGMVSASAERAILDGIAFSLDDSSSSGMSVRLVPPYQFNETATIASEMDLIRDELLESTYFTESAASAVLQLMREGFEDGS